MPLPAPTFPSVIDNSMRSAFASCPLKFFRMYCLNIHPANANVHFHAGIAFAKGIETTRLAFYRDNESADSAIQKGYQEVLAAYGELEFEDSTKTAINMASALLYYFSVFQLETDFVKPHMIGNSPLVEFNFTVPLPINHPDTGEPLLYYGRFDMVGEVDGVLYIVDEKTTSQLGPTWGRRYDLSSQFTGYAWGAQAHGKPIGAVLIRGISILKSGHGHAQHIMYRPQWQIDRWYAQLLRDIESMIAQYKSGVWNLNLSDSCSSFSGCPFSKVCQIQDHEPWLLGPDYKHFIYNPLEIK